MAVRKVIQRSFRTADEESGESCVRRRMTTVLGDRVGLVSGGRDARRCPVRLRARPSNPAPAMACGIGSAVSWQIDGRRARDVVLRQTPPTVSSITGMACKTRTAPRRPKIQHDDFARLFGDD